MKKKWVAILLPIIAIILELLPYGAVLNFAPGPGETLRKTYSYFSLMPFGYANFGPFMTALLTCIILLLAVILLFRDGKGIKKALFICSIIAIVTSLMPLMFGVSYLTVVGGCITVVLVAECLITRK